MTYASTIGAPSGCHAVFDGSCHCRRTSSDRKTKGGRRTANGSRSFQQTQSRGEIVESSPLYDQLRPIADAISRVAQPQYNHPFKFYLVHETQPNAFAAPGGNVYRKR